LISVEDVKAGRVSQLTISECARLKNKAPQTIRRKIDAGLLPVKEDPTTVRPIIPVDDVVIAYLEGVPFARNYQRNFHLDDPGNI
jgi:hypothetical protein